MGMGKSATTGVAFAVLLTCLVSMSAGFLVQDGKNFLMYFDETEVAITSKETKIVETVTYAPTGNSITYNVDGDPRVVNVKLSYWPVADKITTFDLKLTFKKGDRGYWNMSDASVTLEGPKLSKPLSDAVLLQGIKLEAPLQRSFHCSNYRGLSPNFATNQGNHTINISFKGLQVQAFSQGKDAGSFSESWDCVGFFSIGIWSGIFIVTMLIGILTWGMAMIMDVKTMDRFDDPKGKTVSFGTAD